MLLLLLLGLRLSMACIASKDDHSNNNNCQNSNNCNFNTAALLAAPLDNHSEALCSTLRTLGQSLEDAKLQYSLCEDSEINSKHYIRPYILELLYYILF